MEKLKLLEAVAEALRQARRNYLQPFEFAIVKLEDEGAIQLEVELDGVAIRLRLAIDYEIIDAEQVTANLTQLVIDEAEAVNPREIVRRYLNLPYSRRIKIIQNLGMYDDITDAKNSQDEALIFMRLVAQNKKLDELLTEIKDAEFKMQ